LGLPLDHSSKLPVRLCFFVAVNPEKSTGFAGDFSANQAGQK
jgi:hypothetical protein